MLLDETGVQYNLMEGFCLEKSLARIQLLAFCPGCRRKIAGYHVRTVNSPTVPSTDAPGIEYQLVFEKKNNLRRPIATQLFMHGTGFARGLRVDRPRQRAGVEREREEGYCFIVD